MKKLLCVLFLCLSACIPAKTPSQLASVPATVVSIDAERVYGTHFTVDYPDAWRVVKVSEAQAPLTFAFAAEENRMVIYLSEAPLAPLSPNPEQYQLEESLTLNGQMLYLQGTSLLELENEFVVIYQALRESIEGI